ncbi:MAG: two-component system CheB/CheR fusion protein [Desulforhopalus sp.]|jgi:two-component system CheB/CheR fusion protein
MVTKKMQSGKTTRRKAAVAQNDNHVPVVGIGASAGGLEAFEAFVKALPDNYGFAYILVVHLDPTHVSVLPEIIQRKTKMKVCQVADNIKIMPDQIYIIPPNKDLAILNDTLQLLETKKPRGANLPIDSFFRSLAQTRGNKAVGIILSGTGTDGTLGIRAIKGEAGMVMVQDLESAKYDGMPRSAIASGMADFILSPDKMPEQLESYARYKTRDFDSSTKTGDEKLINALQRIYIVLRNSTDHDFSLYKKNTIIRCIERRMQVHQIEDIDDYVRCLQESETETNILFKELLIGVTSFFRDIIPFELLKEKYLPELLQDKPDDYQVRVWVPGCSSGEEVYSIAIILREYMENVSRHFEVQIFGTDLDEQAINIARTGKYPHSIVADVTEERLKKYFTKGDDHYLINKSVREMVVFAPQNIIKYPPFTRLDLLCCRNLLIYFGQELQNKLFPIFHYSLNQDGLLFLGSSESIGQTTDLFTALDKKWKIYKCQSTSKARHPILNLPTVEPVVLLPQVENKRAGHSQDLNTVRLLKTILAESNLPPCVVIDDSANILYVHGRTGRFLEPAEGVTCSNILKMARPGLHIELSRLISQMAVERQEIKTTNLRINDSSDYVDFNLTLRPLADFHTGQSRLTMVIFEQVLTENEEKTNFTPPYGQIEKSDEVKKLEDVLQSTIEEMETANEELKSSNEELQSTNEELETSKEEMQSLNEESATVNSELQSRIDDLIATNDDIKNLLDATEIATIFLDIDLQIRRFTPMATHLFHLTSADIGRPISHFATSLQDVQLVENAEKVLTDLGQQESEVNDNKGKKYRMRLRPYRTLNNVIDGVVVTFEDITQYTELVAALTESESLWRGLIENAPMGIFIIANEKFSYINPEALEIFGASSPKEIVGKPVVERVHPDSEARFKKQTYQLLGDNVPISAIEEKWLRLDGVLVELVISATPVIFNREQSALVFVREKISAF